MSSSLEPLVKDSSRIVVKKKIQVELYLGKDHNQFRLSEKFVTGDQGNEESMETQIVKNFKRIGWIEMIDRKLAYRFILFLKGLENKERKPYVLSQAPVPRNDDCSLIG